MRYLILIISVLFASSCATIVDHNKRYEFPETKEMRVSIHKFTGGNPKTLAYVEITNNECKVYLRRYPQCLTHEIRHCFEGNWHEGRKTDEDC